jgi:hypothetical protein
VNQEEKFYMRTKRGDKHDQWIFDIKINCEEKKTQNENENKNLVHLEKTAIEKNGFNRF